MKIVNLPNLYEFLCICWIEDISKNAVIKHLLVPIDFCSIFFPTMEVNGDQQMLFKIKKIVFNKMNIVYVFGVTFEKIWIVFLQGFFFPVPYGSREFDII